jgi:hypothetical protein
VVSDAMGRVVLRKEISGTDIVRVPSNAGTRVCFVRATAGGNNIAVGRIIMER